MGVKIGVAEDNFNLAEALKEKLSFFDGLDLKFIGVNGKDFIKLVQGNHNLDVVLMDIQMPEMDGIEATQLLKSRYPHIKVIMLTIFDSDEYIFSAIRAGADGYLLKETSPQELYDGILDVLKGGAAMTPSIALRTLNFIKNLNIENIPNIEEEHISLTKRELEILTQLSKGLNTQLIAENLFISSGTVRKHIENIYKKLQVHNKVEAVQKGIKHNLI